MIEEPTILLRATLLVKAAVQGDLTIEVFVKEYGNFYYYNALDGHEAQSAAEREQQSKYGRHIRLHHAIQTEVVDLFYPGEPQPAYQAVGRLNATPALERLRLLAEQHSLDGLLKELSQTPGKNS